MTDETSPHRETGRAIRDAGGIPPGPWRVGSQCGRNLWIGPPRPDGVDVGRMDTDALAAYVVQAVNERDRLRAALEAIHAIASDTDDSPDRLPRSPGKQLRVIARAAAEALNPGGIAVTDRPELVFYVGADAPDDVRREFLRLAEAAGQVRNSRTGTRTPPQGESGVSSRDGGKTR